MLRKHLSDSFHELEVQPVELREDISYEVQSVEIMDRKGGKLWSKEIVSVKVVWSRHPREEVTWELKEEILNKYSYLFELDGKTSVLKV